MIKNKFQRIQCIDLSYRIESNENLISQKFQLLANDFKNPFIRYENFDIIAYILENGLGKAGKL